MIRGLVRPIQNLIYKTLFPLKCISCNKEGSFLCRVCSTRVRSFPAVRQAGFNAAHISQLWSCFPYETPISDLIILGKYNFMPEVFASLGIMAANHLKSHRELLDGFLLCPIPLSKQRQRWRGFNQSQKLCETFARELGLPWRSLLLRSRNTKTQKDLDRVARQKNVRGCFLLHPKAAPLASRRRILLVDDVATTGATLNAAAEVLIQAGASKVAALTIARD